MSTLVPVVAFEHHRRLDGTGYPDIRRNALNLATALCCIADVYDAMRSERPYQSEFPSDRILAVLKQRNGRQFDSHLIRRFVQLIGIYPVGSLVRLDTGQIALVVKVHAPDPYRPQVRILIDRGGVRLAEPLEVNLWEGRSLEGQPGAVVAPVDQEALGFDPLTLL
jgi:HD-GYP domain-containing protein (c-di-GMP phosphodiesterase class II)